MGSFTLKENKYIEKIFDWRVLCTLLLFLFAFSYVIFAEDAPSAINTTGTAATVNDPKEWLSDLKSSGVLNSIENYFIQSGINAMIYLKPTALYLAAAMGVISICTTWTLYEGQLKFFELVRNIIFFSFIFFLIQNLDWITKDFINGFKWLGAVAAGLLDKLDTNFTTNVYTPSGAIDMGWSAIAAAWHKVSFMSDPGGFIFVGIACLLAYIGAFWIGLQILLTSIEFSIFTGLGIILLPFAMFKVTNFLFQRFISGLFSFGVKMMTVYFLAGLSMTVLRGMAGIEENAVSSDKLTKISDTVSNATSGGDFGQILNFCLVYFVIGYLVWKIPNIVQMMVSGQPQMNAGGMIGAGIGLAAMAFTAAKAGANMAGSAKATWNDTKSGGSSSNESSGSSPNSDSGEASSTEAAANGNQATDYSSASGSTGSQESQVSPAAKEAQEKYSSQNITDSKDNGMVSKTSSKENSGNEDTSNIENEAENNSAIHAVSAAVMAKAIKSINESAVGKAVKSTSNAINNATGKVKKAYGDVKDEAITRGKALKDSAIEKFNDSRAGRKLKQISNIELAGTGFTVGNVASEIGHHAINRIKKTGEAVVDTTKHTGRFINEGSKRMYAGGPIHQNFINGMVESRQHHRDYQYFKKGDFSNDPPRKGFVKEDE